LVDVSVKRAVRPEVVTANEAAGGGGGGGGGGVGAAPRQGIVPLLEAPLPTNR
jgi:hypothetical protein